MMNDNSIKMSMCHDSCKVGTSVSLETGASRGWGRLPARSIQTGCQGTPAAYPPVTGQGHLNRCGSAKAGWVSSATPMWRHAVSDIYTTDHNRLPSVDCDTFGLTANVSGIKVWVIPLHWQLVAAMPCTPSLQPSCHPAYPLSHTTRKCADNLNTTQTLEYTKDKYNAKMRKWKGLS
jgi:hypothetical protein